MFKKHFFVSVIFLLIAGLFPSMASADLGLSGDDTVNGTVSVATPITGLQITGSTVDPVPVKLLVSSGSLSMSTTTGLTFNGATTGSTLYFSGSLANVNAALATLTYTRGSTGSDTLEVSLVEEGEVFFTENNHLYKFISGSITANAARTAALNQTAYGATGYLATITSQEENDFVAERLEGDGWMGASDAAVEGDWRWLDGPEAGTLFWRGAVAGSAQGGNYENWSSGEPNDYNNGSPGEDCAQFYISSSLWNDLPCTGNNLTGYIVEFGAPGDMPTVTAKNISITTVANPTLSSLSPTDNATGVAVDTDLVIEFSKTVVTDSGDILIKKTSDDTTIDTIAVTSDQVTGNNSDTITLSLSTNLAESTGYYVTIPNTAFEDTLGNAFAGISSTTSWNFTTGDFTDPGISEITVTDISTTAATITWTTDENSSTQVRYGLSTSYGSTTSESDTSPRVASHSVPLTSLLACTTYHYQVISKDSSNNTTTSSDRTFTTTGCENDAEPTSETSNAITSSSGGTTSLTENSTQIEIETPVNFTDEAETVVIQIKALPKTPVLSSLGRPTQVPREVGSIVFDVKAIINSTTVLDSFDAPITITYQYTDEDTTGLDESTFWLYHYHDGEWQALDDCDLNTSTNTIVCTTESFSIFGLFGDAESSGTTSSTNTSSSSSNSAPACTNTRPSHFSDLFQIDVSDTQARLYFTPLTEHVSDYFVAYGYESGDERFGTMTGLGTSSGVLAYTINELSPNTTYRFKLRPQNGCMPGDWSNEIEVTTAKTNNSNRTFYKNFMSQLLAVFPQ